MSRFGLEGKRILITGAAAGIGEAIARNFSEAGARLILVDIDEENGNRVAGAIERDGGLVQFRRLDIGDEPKCRRVAAAVQDQGPLDVLVNNAGIGCVGTLLETEGDDLDRLYRVNVRGAFNLCKVFLPGMIERGRGNIINLASIGGVVAVRDRLAYCVSKFAVVGLTKSIALDHARQGIRCNCICPGRVETPFVAARLKEYADPVTARREMEATQALGRMARPEEIACAARYLASDESAFVTGTDFVIDGGWSAGK